VLRRVGERLVRWCVSHMPHCVHVWHGARTVMISSPQNSAMAMSRADCLALLSLFVSARFSSCASVTDVRQPGGKGCGGCKERGCATKN
jgi:hypothetical protein